MLVSAVLPSRCCSCSQHLLLWAAPTHPVAYRRLHCFQHAVQPARSTHTALAHYLTCTGTPISVARLPLASLTPHDPRTPPCALAAWTAHSCCGHQCGPAATAAGPSGSAAPTPSPATAPSFCRCALSARSARRLTRRRGTRAAPAPAARRCGCGTWRRASPPAALTATAATSWRWRRRRTGGRWWCRQRWTTLRGCGTLGCRAPGLARDCCRCRDTNGAREFGRWMVGD